MSAEDVLRLPLHASESLDWNIEDAEHCVVAMVDIDESGEPMTESSKGAAEIVRKVNAHADLVEALTALVERIYEPVFTADAHQPIKIRCRICFKSTLPTEEAEFHTPSCPAAIGIAAIKKARGE